MKDFGKRINTALLIALCALFFVLAMGLTMLASDLYRKTAADADLHFTQRTALSYLVNQTRQADAAGGVSAGSFGGSDALFLREGGYVTILYVWEGQLRELYMADGLGLPPEAGIPLLPLRSLRVEHAGGLVTFTVTDEAGSVYTASVCPRCGVGQEAAS